MQGQIHGIVGTVYGLYTINTVRTVIPNRNVIISQLFLCIMTNQS